MKKAEWTSVVLIAMAVTWAVSRAGDVNPPQGSVGPSMPSLQEISNQLSAAATPTAWSHTYASQSTANPAGVMQAVTGSGTLHAVYIDFNSTDFPPSVILSDHVGSGSPPLTSRIATFATRDAFPATVQTFDVRFENGLHLSGLGSGAPSMTLIYRLDP